MRWRGKKKMDMSMTRMFAPSSAAPRRRREPSPPKDDEDELSLSFEGGNQEPPVRRVLLDDDAPLAKIVRNAFLDFCYWRLLSPSGEPDYETAYTFDAEVFGSQTEIFRVKETPDATGTKQRVWCHLDDGDGNRLSVSDIPSEFPRRVNVGETGTSLDRIWLRAVRRARGGRGSVRCPDVKGLRFFHDAHRNGMTMLALRDTRKHLLTGPVNKLTRFAFDARSLVLSKDQAPEVRKYVANNCNFFWLMLQEHDEYFKVEPGQAEQPEAYTMSGGRPGDADMQVLGPCGFRVWINQLANHPNPGDGPSPDAVYEFFSVHLNLMLLDFVWLMTH
jgi:hypothetical protein